MTESQKWLEEGHRLEDQGKFNEAIAFFEKAAFDEKTMSHAVDRLIENWMYARLRFADQLLARFPDSAVAVHLKVALLHQVNAFSSAHRLCSNYLHNNPNANETQVLNVRKLRLRSAMLGRITDHFVEDTITVFVAISESYRRGQYELIGDLLSVKSIEFVEAFTLLSDDEQFPDAVRRLFRQKATMLQALHDTYK